MNISSSFGGVSNLTAPPPPPGGGNDKVKAAMQAAASKLGLSDDELRAKLRSGSTLGDVAKAQGVSTDDLRTAMTDALSGTSSSAATGSVDASSLADDLIAGKGPRGPHGPGGHGGPPPGPPPSDASDTADDNMTSLAGALGVDKATLLGQLQSGDLSSLLKAAKASSYGSYATGAAVDGGLQVDTYA